VLKNKEKANKIVEDIMREVDSNNSGKIDFTGEFRYFKLQNSLLHHSKEKNYFLPKK